jgi:hypothetical protein
MYGYVENLDSEGGSHTMRDFYIKHMVEAHERGGIIQNVTTTQKRQGSTLSIISSRFPRRFLNQTLLPRLRNRFH